ncbi:MAG: GyrI-like domain-containing protein [Oscillospiraceae bacterium]|nr:GyrI-like domain-containing protein [Oscillospiraceae bacterium]
MKYEISIESLPEKVYLAIRGYMSWREITPDEYAAWESKYGFPKKELTEQLKIKSGTNEVYSLFCNSCVKDEEFDWVCGDDLACENLNNAKAGDGFEIIRLAPSDYCKIIYFYKNDITGEQAAKEADDYFWNEWLKNNPYTSKIEGGFSNDPETADITLCDEDSKKIIAWHPIERT